MFSLSILRIFAFALPALAQGNFSINPLSSVNETANTGYFSDPFHVTHGAGRDIYITGSTHEYLECDTLRPRCASFQPNRYNTSDALHQAASKANATICWAFNINPHRFGSDNNTSWDAVVTLNVQSTPKCDTAGWSVIVHAHPEDSCNNDKPPPSWIGDEVLVGSFSENVYANYDGKYFTTPEGALHLIYQKNHSKKPKRDGIAALPMDDPKTKKQGGNETFLLIPSDDLNSENFVAGDDSFKLIETGNIRAINGKFIMAYSTGAFDRQTYKMGVAYSDTFLPVAGQQYRKVMKDNPDHLWGTKGAQEVLYLLQSDQKADGWRYAGDQVIAPGVPTIADFGNSSNWVATFAGYAMHDHPLKNGTQNFIPDHRRPYYVGLEVNVPANATVKAATDEELQKWIVPTLDVAQRHDTAPQPYRR